MTAGRGVLYDKEKTEGRINLSHPSIRPASNDGGEMEGGGREIGGGEEDERPFIPPLSSSWLKLY